MKDGLIFIIISFVFFVSHCNAAISFDANGRWKTTFDCADWIHPNPGSCDELTLTGGGPSGTITNKTQITYSANHPLGEGAKGIRFWVKQGDDVLSAPIYANLSSPEHELWVRYYTRWESGFEWAGGLPGYEKSWYIRTYPSGDPSAIPGMAGNNWRIVNQGGVQTGGGRYLDAANKGWNYIYPGGTSDGSWHAVEFYIKMQSAIGVADGRAKVWIDGILVGEHNEIEWSTSDSDALAGWIQFMFRSNQNSPSSTTEMYIDYDDIAIYNTTPPSIDAHGDPFIGPIGWGGPVSAPSLPDSRMPIKETQLVSESFSDNNWSSRGWYDGTNSTSVVYGGISGNALRWTWANASSRPEGFSVIRREFPATDEFLIEYYVKYEDSWQGSGLNWHPHLIHVMSTDDSAYQSLSRANSGLYFESLATSGYPYTNYPQFAHQDFWRTNTSFGIPAIDLTKLTEMRSTNQCNTPYSLSGANTGTCYNDGAGWYSANTWKSSTVSIPPNQWVKITGYVKKNTFTGETGNHDGIIRLWVDSQLAIESTRVLYVAGAYSDSKWNKVVLAPYIGNGSPVQQSMWLDELSVWTIDGNKASTLSPPSSFRPDN